MGEFLNSIRYKNQPMPVRKRAVNTMMILWIGVILGLVAKYLDTVPVNELPPVLAYLDVRNFLGRFAFWVLAALCIAVYSNSSVRAAINVFLFFVGMVSAYYLYSCYAVGFFPKSYAMIWFGATAASPVLAFVCWYAKGRSRKAFALSALILAVLFNMTFVYGQWYIEPLSVLEAAVFVIGFVVLRRSSVKCTALLCLCALVLAVLLKLIVPFQFG